MFGNITDRIRLLFRKDKGSYLRFYEILGFYPRKIELYKQAVLHRSTAMKSDKGRPLNNERLEFLGDAILDAVVADIVYKKFEGRKEGFLTNTRSKIVQRETLNRVGSKLGLDTLIQSAAHQQSHNSNIVGNAFEALVGAIYLDRGYEACLKFMQERVIAPYLNLDKISRKEVNFKSKLLEWSQKYKFVLAFEDVGESYDEEQNLMFEARAVVENIVAGRGKGYSKKEAQQEAAKRALKKIKSDPKFIDTIFATKSAREDAALGIVQPESKPEEPKLETTSLKEVKEQELAVAHEIQEGAHQDEEEVVIRYDDVERIISQAEEAAFREEENEETHNIQEP